jgi:hypothetical protein
VLALWSNRWLNGVQLGLPVQLALGLSIDWRVLLFSAAVCMGTALAFGLVPALRATRGDLSSVLKEESRATGGPGKRLARGTLVVAQVALSLLLLICAGLSLRSTYNAHRIDPGFDSSGVVVASLHPQLQGYSSAEAEDFFRRLLEQVRGLPGVESAGVASHLLLSFEVHTENVTSDDGQPLPPEEWPEIDAMGVGPGYFEMMRIPLLQGRGFTEQDGPETTKVAVVNESRPADEADAQIGHLQLQAAVPDLVEREAADPGEEIDAARREADLIHEPRRREIGRSDAVSLDGGAEGA